MDSKGTEKNLANFGILVESGETAIKKPYSNDESRNELKNEIEILLRISKYNHLNIVKLMEYSVESVHINKIFNKTSDSIFYFLFSYEKKISLI